MRRLASGTLMQLALIAEEYPHEPCVPSDRCPLDVVNVLVAEIYFFEPRSASV